MAAPARSASLPGAWSLEPGAGALCAPDIGLSLPELAAVRRGVLVETNPNHLLGFAAALAPEHCVSASLLHARAETLELRRTIDPRALHSILAAIAALATQPAPPSLHEAELLRRRYAVDQAAAHLRTDPRILYGAVRSAAGDLVVDDTGRLDDLPAAVADLARALVERIEVQGAPAVRVLNPSSVRIALPPSTGMTAHDQLERRARWVRQYAQEAMIASAG
jgi:hypothetical protein